LWLTNNQLKVLRLLKEYPFCSSKKFNNYHVTTLKFLNYNGKFELKPAPQSDLNLRIKIIPTNDHFDTKEDIPISVLNLYCSPVPLSRYK